MYNYLNDVKRRCLVNISCEASSNSKGMSEEEERASPNNTTVREVDDLEVEVRPIEAQKS